MTEKAYVEALLAEYLRLPDTPARSRPLDRRLARDLHRQQVPLPLALTALRLGAARRAWRPDDAPALSPVRSLAYFRPILEELRHPDLDAPYLDYLHRRLQPATANRPASARTAGGHRS